MWLQLNISSREREREALKFKRKLAKGPGVARGKKMLKKNFQIFFSLATHEFQPNRFREHIYECLVLLYRYAFFALFQLLANKAMVKES